MTSSRQALGRWGENLAADFLSQKGYHLLERNYRTPYGEIDLIIKKRSLLAFVEVKTRASDTFGLPEETITSKKRQHLIAAAQAYLQAFPSPTVDWRINVIAIRKIKTETNPEIIHFVNAVT
jgi:putative endonuclease